MLNRHHDAGWASSIFLAWAFASLLAAAPQQATQRQEEAADYYRKWLEEDVVYIITAEERDVFLKLQTDAEKDRFIEEFWRRRDTDPSHSANEFKEEHYRRIQYANEHFTAGLPGWKTDRGKVYIKFGPPDDIQDYPAGSTYVRAGHEGGGTTLVNPYQVWRYNYIEGIGSNIEIEFVDPQGGNLYRFARDAQEKDMLLFHPLGYTLAEQLVGGDKTERIVTRQLGDVDEDSDNLSGYTTRSRDMPLERLRLYRDIEAPPPIKFNDLKKVVTTRIQYAALPVTLAETVFRLDRDRAQVLVSVSVPDQDLTFESAGTTNRGRATVDLYGMVSTVGNLLVYEFEDSLVRERAAEEPTRGKSVMSKTLFLPAGRYKLSVVVRDVGSGKLGTLEQALVVPSQPAGLAPSGVLLAHRISEAGTEGTGTALMGGRYTALVNPDRIFPRGAILNFYLEVYGFAVDQSTGQPALNVDVRVLQDGKPVGGLEALLKDSRFRPDLSADRMALLGRIPTAGLAPGEYRLEIDFEDRIQSSRTTAATSFRIGE